MRFTKMHGCGNDFVIVEEPVALDPGRVRALCDRRTGIGADGVLVVGAPRGRAWPMAIHNADGSTAEACGNGSRCVARYLLDRHGGDELVLATEGGDVRAWRDQEGIAIELGEPEVGDRERLAVDGGEVDLVRVLAGNRNLVTFVAEPALVDLERHAAAARALAGDGNVEAAVVTAPDAITMRVHERGAGETLACGTGACAAVAAAAAFAGVTSDTVRVSLPGGTLVVRRGVRTYVLAGPADYVFSGETS